MPSHKLLTLFHLKTCHVLLTWISSSDNPYPIHCISPMNRWGINSHYALCLEQGLSNNRYLMSFVGWIKQSIGLTFYLPDHLSQNVSFLSLILIMESWLRGMWKPSSLKSMRCQIGSGIYSKTPFWLDSRKIWPLLPQKRVFSSSQLGQGIVEFYNLKCKDYRDYPFCLLPPWGTRFRSERVWPRSARWAVEELARMRTSSQDSAPSCLPSFSCKLQDIGKLESEWDMNYDTSVSLNFFKMML